MLLKYLTSKFGNLSELVDKIAVGPQRKFIERVETFNRNHLCEYRYNNGEWGSYRIKGIPFIGITEKFTWKWGTLNSIKETWMKKVFFNSSYDTLGRINSRIRRTRWDYRVRNFLDQFEDFDKSLRQLRYNGAAQSLQNIDIDDLIEKTLDHIGVELKHLTYYLKCKLRVVDDFSDIRTDPNWKTSVYVKFSKTGNDIDVVLWFWLPKSKLNIWGKKVDRRTLSGPEYDCEPYGQIEPNGTTYFPHDSEKIQELPIGGLFCNVKMNFSQILYHISSDKKAYQSLLNDQDGGYHTFMNRSDKTHDLKLWYDNSNHSRLQHPYVYGDKFTSGTYDVGVHAGLPIHIFSHHGKCFGNYGKKIQFGLRSGSVSFLAWQLDQWRTNYYQGKTGPLRQPDNLYFGKPKDINFSKRYLYIFGHPNSKNCWDSLSRGQSSESSVEAKKRILHTCNTHNGGCLLKRSCKGYQKARKFINDSIKKVNAFHKTEETNTEENSAWDPLLESNLENSSEMEPITPIPIMSIEDEMINWARTTATGGP